MGVSFSSALWSPSLQARSSVLMSSTAGSPVCAALGIAYGLNYTAAPGMIRSRRILRLFRVEAHMRRRLYLLALSFALGAASNVRADGPTFTTIDFPGAVSTQLWGINPAGDIVGFYTLSDTSSHGFLLSGQNFTPIDFPGSAVTFLYGINPRGDIVGEYASTLTGPHTGFVRTRDGN